MVIWINGCFGVGKTTTAKLLEQKIGNARIYDPEIFGSLLWAFFPKSVKETGDFQDLILWRRFTYTVIRFLSGCCRGHILVPMTLVNPQYYDEIIGALRRDGVIVRHFILTASKEDILSRLRRRGEVQDSWAERQLARCLDAFAGAIPGEKINTEQIPAEQAAAQICSALFPATGGE